MKLDDKFDRKVCLGDVLVKHKCYQCNETNFSEIKLTERAWWWSKLYTECPNCKTKNDIWQEGAKPPMRHLFLNFIYSIKQWKNQ